MVGTLSWTPVATRLDLVAPPVAAALRLLSGLADVAGPAGPADTAGLDAGAGVEAVLDAIRVAEIDPDLADTAAFCEAYSIGLEISANCVVVAAKRGGSRSYAACVVLATTRADVNGVVRRHLDARKVSFAPMDDAVAETGMEYGGITPIGLPDGWPLLIDEQVAKSDQVVIGSGLRRSKLLLPATLLTRLPTAQTQPLTL